MAGRATIELVWMPALTLVADVYFEMADRAKHLVEPVTEITQLFSAEIEENFQVEGRPSRWPALSEATITQKLLGPTWMILQRTGKLKGEATNSDNWHVSGSSREVVAQLQDPTGYGMFHITGTVDMPQRDWSYISDDALDEAEEIMLDWVTEPWETGWP